MAGFRVAGSGGQSSLRIAAAAVLALWLSSALGPAAVGAEVRPRIVALSPHITELLFTAGAGAELVGMDDSSDFPPAAGAVPRVGEPGALDLERLLSLRPTLIIAWQSGTPPRALAELERLKVPLVLTEQRHLDDIGNALEEFGRLAGTEATANAAAQRYRRDLAALRARYAGREQLSVFYQVWDRPLYTLAGGQVLGEVLSLCGGRNIFEELSTLAPVVDRESVLARNPAVILIGASGAEGARQAAEWSHFSRLAAAEQGHIYSIDPSLLGRMSTRLLQGATQVCEILDQARSTSRLQ
jgi:iron complex transport system substrate-binding protein